MVLENRSFKFNEFLRLRADHHAQYEIRAYADVMLDTLKDGCQQPTKPSWIIG